MSGQIQGDGLSVIVSTRTLKSMPDIGAVAGEFQYRQINPAAVGMERGTASGAHPGALTETGDIDIGGPIQRQGPPLIGIFGPVEGVLYLRICLSS